MTTSRIRSGFRAFGLFPVSGKITQGAISWGRGLPSQTSVRTGAAHGELPEGQEKPPWGAPGGRAKPLRRDEGCSTDRIGKTFQ